MEEHSCYNQPGAGKGMEIPFLSLPHKNWQLTGADCNEPATPFRKVKHLSYLTQKSPPETSVSDWTYLSIVTVCRYVPKYNSSKASSTSRLLALACTSVTPLEKQFQDSCGEANTDFSCTV